MANRYVQFSPQEYKNTFVPTPFDFIQSNLEGRQRAFDIQEQQRLDILGKQIDPLQKESDINAAKKAKQEVDSLLESYSSKDLTDPSIKNQFQKDVRNVKNRFGPMGDIGAIHSRREQAAKQMQAIDEFAEKNKVPGYIKDYQKKQFLNNIPDFGVDESTGIYRGVGTPQLEQHIDANEQIGKYVKDIAYQQMSSIDPRARAVEGDPFSYYTSEGKIQTLPRQQILDAAYAKYQADIPLQKSIQQEAAAISSGNQKFANQLAGNPFQVDEQGRIKRDKRGEPLINPNSLLGAAFEGTAKERAFRREDISMDINADFASRKAAEDAALGTPIYERPEINEIEFKPAIDFGGIIDPKTRSEVSRVSATLGGGKSSYELLKPEDQKKFDNIAKSLFPKEDKKSEETFNKVKEYVELTSQLASSTPYTTTPYQGVKGESNRVAATKNLKNNFQNRVFYKLSDNEVVEGSNDDIKELFDVKDPNVEVVGDFDNKNYFNLLSGKKGLQKPLAVRINGELYAVSPESSRVTDQQGIVNEDVNKIFAESTSKPLVEQDFKIGKYDYKVAYNPQNDSYLFKWDDGKQSVVVDNKNLTLDQVVEMIHSSK